MKHWMTTAAFALTALSASAADPVAPVSYRDAIAPIFQDKCTGCHGAQKQKAGLRLDSHAGVMKGDEDGAVVVAGDPKKSPLYQAITLPKDHEDHMPPPKKPQLTEDEIAKIKAWIEKGAAGES